MQQGCHARSMQLAAAAVAGFLWDAFESQELPCEAVESGQWHIMRYWVRLFRRYDGEETGKADQRSMCLSMKECNIWRCRSYSMDRQSRRHGIIAWSFAGDMDLVRKR